MSDKLSVIVIQIDSLCRHFLQTYGNDWVKTPHLDAFARKAAVFERHYTGSLPCMPARREIWTGTEEFWWRCWGPLEPWDQPIAHLAAQQGIPSQLVTDHYHFFEWGSHNYFYDYDGYTFIRGHESDNWRTDPVDPVPDWARVMIERKGAGPLNYVRNVQDFKGEADFFGPKVMQATADWLDANHGHEQFFLHVDCFDVHEPFHIPEPYRSMYTGEDYRKYNAWPNYGRIDEGRAAIAAGEVEWVRAQYAGKLTMVDTWFAQVLERLDRHKLWDRTCVIVTTDHGHYLGDHGWMGKPRAPMYHTLCHIPLFVWHPGGANNGRRVSAVTQTVDLYATVLELLGVAPAAGAQIHSRSFAPLITGKSDTHRDYAVYGYASDRIGITRGEWTLLRDHDPAAAPACWYSHHAQQLNSRGWGARKNRSFDFPALAAGRYLPGVDAPVWRMPAAPGRIGQLPPPRDDLLFHNPSDPRQDKNVAAENPDVVRDLAATLKQHAESVGAPEEQLKRLRLA